MRILADEGKNCCKKWEGRLVILNETVTIDRKFIWISFKIVIFLKGTGKI